MTIIVPQGVRQGPIQGGIPRLGESSGIYSEEIQLVGDASGGQMIAQFNFTTQPTSKSGRMFTLEQVGFTLLAAAARGVGIRLFNWDIVDRTRNRWGMEVGTSDPDGSGSVIPQGTELINKMGVFLGQQTVGGVSSVVNVSLTNGNGDTLSVGISGYWWDPVAKRAPGGLRRPAGPFPI